MNITLTNKESQGKEKPGQSILLGTRDLEKMCMTVWLVSRRTLVSGEHIGGF